MGNPIVFSPSDIDENASAAIAVPKPAAPTPISSHVTFSPSDIDENASAAMASAPSTAQPVSMYPGANPSGNIYPGAPADANATADISGPGVMNAFGRGITSFGNDIPNPFAAVKSILSNPVATAKGIASATPLGTVFHGVKNSIAGYEAYEKARTSGADVVGALHAASETMKAQDAAAQMVKQRSDEFKKDPSGQSVRALLDAAGIAATYFIGTGAGSSAGGITTTSEVAPELAAESTAGESALGDEAATAASTPPAASESTAAPVTPPPAPAIVTPKATAVAQGVSKAADAGVSEGAAETVAPTGEDIQPQLHAGIRNFVNSTLDDAGLDAVPDTVPITDAPQQLADSFQARSQTIFDKVEELTGVNPTTLKEQMSARADQITEASAAGDVEKAGKLEMLQKADENRSIQAFNQAKAQGVDVDQARSDWNASIRGDELSAAVRGSKANTSTLQNPVLDPGKLAPRLQKLAESQPGGKASKLFQLGGEDNATALVEHAENARDATAAIKDFVPSTATGQKLFGKIVENNTAEKSSLLRGGKTVGTTDWNGVVKDIGNLTPAQQSALGNDLARMRQVANKQAVKQNAFAWLTGTTTLGKTARVALVEEVGRRALR
jgi:hypothetical protein